VIIISFYDRLAKDNVHTTWYTGYVGCVSWDSFKSTVEKLLTFDSRLVIHQQVPGGLFLMAFIDTFIVNVSQSKNTHKTSNHQLHTEVITSKLSPFPAIRNIVYTTHTHSQGFQP